MNSPQCLVVGRKIMAAVIEEIVLDDEKEYEIVNGQPEEKITGRARHGGIFARLIAKLWNFVEANNLGGVYGPDTTFKIGENQRLPDVSFVSAARIPQTGEPEGIWEIAPNLAVGIISPNDIYVKVLNKVRDYFAGGVRQVWVVSPGHKLVTVHLTPTDARILNETDELTCAEILPGFRLPLKELFKTPAHR
jgi:Uma2 family endonuclease